MTIIKDKYDSTYPFKISNSWGEISCTLKDLKELKREINRLLKEEKEKSEKK